MNEVITKLDDPTPVNPGGGGVMGDPYWLKPDGTLVEFIGLAGVSYLYAKDANVTVTFRIASIPGNLNGKTMVDQVTVKCPGHTLVIGLTSVTMDGKAITKTSAPTTIANGSYQWHTGQLGENRVDLLWTGWNVGTIIDPGTDTRLHATTSPLHGKLHLGLFVMQPASATPGMTGLISAVGNLINASTYVVAG